MHLALTSAKLQKLIEPTTRNMVLLVDRLHICLLITCHAKNCACF